MKRKIRSKLLGPFDVPSLTFQYILSVRPGFLLVGISLCLVVLIYLTGMVIPFFNELVTSWSETAKTPWIDESLKALGVAFFAGIVALIISNTWQQKNTAIEMLKELQSPGFHAARYALSA